jgi:predicted metal-dependent hydrolase
MKPTAATQALRLKLLKKRADNYLWHRLETLARTHGFTEYREGKLGLRKTRWGSCTSHKVISLNIALMTIAPRDSDLPNALIDYVIIHELCHTRHMNHSRNFWAEVGKYDPFYREHRRALRGHKPQL